MHPVLIETLWNVKTEDAGKKIDTLSINRNLVECKERKIYLKVDYSLVLIETLWNVKRSDHSNG